MADPAGSLADWAARQAGVKAVVLIGSRTRAAGASDRADANSDWDFHLITSQPARFAHAGWTVPAGWGPPLAYVDRPGVLGSARKISAVFPGWELDLVLLPAWRLQLAQVAMSLGLHRQSAGLRRVLGELAVVIRPGYRFLHGAAPWEPFYRQVVAEVADPRLDDGEIVRLANGFVCDYVWLRRKVARGELAAARRMLRRALDEVNLRLAHELRLRRGLQSFPDARRLEQTAGPEEAVRLVSPAASGAEEILAVAGRSGATLRELMHGLVGPAWHWPEPIE